MTVPLATLSGSFLWQGGRVIDVRILAEPKADDFSVQLAHAVAAEAAGFSGWFRSEHLVMQDQEVAGTDAIMVLAGLATQTSRLRLGTLMSPATFRTPGQLAVQVAQLDRMSRGMELTRFRGRFGYAAGGLSACSAS